MDLDEIIMVCSFSKSLITQIETGECGQTSNFYIPCLWKRKAVVLTNV